MEEALFLATRLIVMSPRPGRIAHEHHFSFNRDYLAGQAARQVKSKPEFIAAREQALDWVAPVGSADRTVPGTPLAPTPVPINQVSPQWAVA